jgi:hypothetical protein
MLTKEECLRAAETARNYPPGYGDSFLAVDVDPDWMKGRGYNPCALHPFSRPSVVSDWIKEHPEDLEKKGCPALVIAAARGWKPGAPWETLQKVVDEVAGTCRMSNAEYCDRLSDNPEDVALLLEKAAEDPDAV